MTDSPVLEIRQFIDKQPFGFYQTMVIGLCVVAVLAEGYDAQAMGYVAPVVSKELHIARSALGPVLSSGLVGMMIGALVLSPLGDRIGRRPAIIFSVLLFGLGSLLTATAHSVTALLVFRVLTGLGLGGSLPNQIALSAEYTPQRLRATAIVAAGCGFSIGATVGGFASAGLLNRFGWQSVFILGGVFPCVIAVLLFALLPESIRFLVLKGGQEERVATYLSRIAPGAVISRGTSFVIEEQRTTGFAPRHLFTEGRARLTLALWVMFFMNLLEVYFLNNWLPTIIHDAGVALEKALIITAMFQGGGTIGALTLGRLVDRTTSYRVLAWSYLTAGVCVFLIGAAGTSVVLLACSVFAAGFCVVGGTIGANALAAESYPTTIRSTGVGWSLGIGRIGSITGPLLGGQLLSAAGGASHVFSVAAVPIVVAGVAGFFAASAQKQNKREASVHAAPGVSAGT